ncbi:YgcG family protein [Prevotella sp. 10(H)]|uniref:TPM domain-containing protein n=1 Tax=Prevotella sp. 10(H) TaxID=1158294 RepID=UPI0004A75EC8|nr:TPM domain-containing protein [Prevotella sp. 10(H)]
MKRVAVILFICFLVSFSLQAQDDLPSPMSPPRLVNDFAQTFNASQSNELEQILRAYNDSTSTQVFVVTVKDLQGYAVSDYAARLGEKWGIGQKDKNNGVLILIKPRIGNERGQVFIATGYGVEHILTDARTGRIIDQYMMPYLQTGDYYNAAKSAVMAIIKYLAGEFQADEDDGGDMAGSLISNIILAIIILIILYISFKNGRNGPSSGGRSRGGGFGGFGGWGGGRSGGGWSSGGGFGGGGGGSFGGGGAGRSF